MYFEQKNAENLAKKWRLPTEVLYILSTFAKMTHKADIQGGFADVQGTDGRFHLYK